MLASFIAVAASSAQADDIFTLTLTANTASPPDTAYGGTGTLDLSTVPSASGNTDYTTSGTPSMALSLIIDGVTFTGTGCTAEYTNGALDTIYGCSFTGGGSNSLSNFYASGTTGGYGGTFPSYGANGNYISGTLTISPEVIPTAEPSTLLLLGLGLLGMMGMVYRRKKLFA